MKKEKNTRGITLIALVVTIIVLIILAVVSINLIFNENGLIKQAEKSKEYQANGTASDEEGMIKYKEKIEEYLPYNLNVDFSGLKIGTALRVTDYGKMTTYKVDNGGEVDTETDGFRLFYQDSVYTYLISNNIISLSDKLENLSNDEKYSNGSKVSDVGKNLNSGLKTKNVNDESYTFFDEKNEATNIKAVAYLTNIDEGGPWSKYVNRRAGALCAIGGPSLPLYAGSYNATRKKSAETGNAGGKTSIGYSVGSYGYLTNCNQAVYWLSNTNCHEIYEKPSGSSGNGWYLSSPSSSSEVVQGVDLNYRTVGSIYSLRTMKMKVRPIVILETDLFETKYAKGMTDD